MNPDLLTRLSLRRTSTCRSSTSRARPGCLCSSTGLVSGGELSGRPHPRARDQGGWAPLAGIVGVARAQCEHGRPAHFIFHSGHVGSTLFSRLLDETGVVLSLREPLPLRTLAEAHDAPRDRGVAPAKRSSTSLALSARHRRCGVADYDGDRAVVLVKRPARRAASPARCSCWTAQSRAVCLNVTAEVYLATLLAGQNSSLDLRGHGAVRIALLQKRLQTPLRPLYALSLGELAAMSWLAETLNQREMIACGLDRVLAARFRRAAQICSRSCNACSLISSCRPLRRRSAALARSPALSAIRRRPSSNIRRRSLADAERVSRRNHVAGDRKGLHGSKAWRRPIAGLRRCSRPPMGCGALSQSTSHF